MPKTYTVYILSNPQGILYKGITENITRRLEQHNQGKSRWTREKGPWRVIYQEEYTTKKEALKREKFFKSGKGRSELKELLSQNGA
ncbi:GIY-YIG nuclease family protein [Candidatus Gracilibacteria bacterium]|nr:GIY-YIG nuclease family protein [Candidatus Gracilibacteria bacterium]MCF7819835.1 GIY-YIG nuclease family protein [Candidatus Gracilibacteria bacterium]